MALAEMWILVPPRVFVCMGVYVNGNVCLYEWVWGRLYCISSLLLFRSQESGTFGYVTIDLPAISAKLLSFPPFTTKYSLHSFMSPLPSVSLFTRNWTALCPAKAALFCLCGLFYPCANRHGRVPELDPIFHAQLSFVWHTAPDKNPNSRTSLILKSNSGAERAFNHPLSVLQWLPFNLPASRLLITSPRSEAIPSKNLHHLTLVSHSSISIDISDCLETALHWMLLGNVSEMSLSFFAGISWSDCGPGFWGTLVRTYCDIIESLCP